MAARKTQDPPTEGSGRLLLAPVVLGALLAVVLIPYSFQDLDAGGQDALGRETTSYFGRVDGFPVNSPDATDLDQVTEGWRRRGERPVVLWLGNSQLHAINQMKEGEISAPLILHQRADSWGLDVLTFSPPSSNLVEHYLLFETLRQKFPVDVVIEKAAFVNQRWTTVRSELQTFLTDPATKESLRETETGRMILSRYSTLDEAVTGEDYAGLRGTWQEINEQRINRWLDENSELWSLRPKARMATLVHLRQLRDSAFRLKVTRKRKMLRAPYETNLTALDEYLRVAGENDIQVILYIIPIRPDQEQPYFAHEYAEWKADLVELAQRHGAIHADLEEIIPARYWGYHLSSGLFARRQPDFWHFQYPAHEILADNVGELLESATQAEAP